MRAINSILVLLLALVVAGPAFSQDRQAQQDMERMDAETLLGTQIFSQDGQEVGEIERVLIDNQSGKVEAVIIGVGGFLGMGEESKIIPWKVISMQQDRHILKVTMDELKQAPSVRDVNNIDDTAIRESYEYFKVDSPGQGQDQQQDQNMQNEMGM